MSEMIIFMGCLLRLLHSMIVRTFYRNENKYYITIFYKKCLHPEYKKNAINHYLPLRIDTIILLSAGHEVMTPVHKRKSDDIIYRLK